MASPQFNGSKIFDSLDASNAPFTEGLLVMDSYEQITQKIHFNGEDGDYTLFFGYPSMEWTFEGLISATTNAHFANIVQGIQSAIDAATADASTYKTLIDSFGYSFPYAQVRHLAWIKKPHTQAGGGLVAEIRVTGIVQGHTHWGTT